MKDAGDFIVACLIITWIVCVVIGVFGVVAFVIEALIYLLVGYVIVITALHLWLVVFAPNGSNAKAA